MVLKVVQPHFTRMVTFVFLRNQADVEAFYRKLNRQTQKGSYDRPGEDVEVFDELAAMRKKKAASR